MDGCNFWISEAPLGWVREEGGEWEVDGRNFKFCCSAAGPVFDNCGFLRPPWDGGGRGKQEEEISWLSPAFGGLLRDPIGSTEYWEIDRAVTRLLLYFFFFLS